MSGGAAAAVIAAKNRRRREFLHHFMLREAVTPRKAIRLKEIPHADEFIAGLEREGVIVSAGSDRYFLSLPGYVERERRLDDENWIGYAIFILGLGALLLIMIYG